MKKVLLIICSFMLLVGCDAMNNTPTKKVEQVLDNYRNQAEVVLIQLNDTVNKDTTMDNDQKLLYITAMKRQYSNLMYKVKDETIDGNNAVVTVEIEVFDYNKVKLDADRYLLENPTEFQDETAVYNEVLFKTYVINQMNKTTDKITYTIDFYVTKVDGIWSVNDLTDTDRQKIHGTYAS